LKKFLPKIKLPVPRVTRLKVSGLKLPNIKIPGISPALGLGEALFSKVTGTLDGGFGLLKSTLGGIPFFGKAATSKSYDHNQFDERHYFLVPEPDDPEIFSLCITRCLPEGVPPVNDLALLDEIDKVDEKAFQGLLLVGGLVALVNPLAGAAVAAKAAIPAIAMVLSKYGLKMASDTANNMDVARQIKKAEKDMKKEFGESNTYLVINPLLANLGKPASLETWLMEKERFQFTCSEFEFSQADLIRLMDLTRDAVKDSCETSVEDDYFKTMRDRVLWSG